MDENKQVTYKKLKVGQEIRGHKLGNLSSMYRAIVKTITPFQVTVLVWGKREEKIDASALFEIKMTEEEIEGKYKDKAKEVVNNLKNKLHRDEIGYHEMWNAWAYGTPYEIAQYCIKDGIKVVGYCTDIIPKTAMFTGDVLDIGICAENEDGERYWCHYRYSDIERMFEKYKDLLDEFTKRS